MNAITLKNLALLVGITISSLTSTGAYSKSMGGDSGGGGDASEERVNEIRSDILKWINDDGAKGLKLPSDISIGEYESAMSDILTPKKVVIGFVEKDDEKNDELKVSVAGVPKTCRGFISSFDNKPHILCNISRFQNTPESDQYKLIHHEFAGLANVENNEGAASDYYLSSQLTDFLTEQVILKLAVKNSKSHSCTLILEKNSDRGIDFLTDEAIISLEGKGYIFVSSGQSTDPSPLYLSLYGIRERREPLISRLNLLTRSSVLYEKPTAKIYKMRQVGDTVVEEVLARNEGGRFQNLEKSRTFIKDINKQVMKLPACTELK